MELETPVRLRQAFEGGLVRLCRPRPWAVPQRAGLPPGAGAPLLLPGGVCWNVYNPEKSKGKAYVNRPYTPGAQKRVGGWPAYVRAVPPYARRVSMA